MKGIIFNLLEEFITENFGEDKYEEIVAGCDLMTKEPFVGPGTYPDEDLFAIVGKTVEVSGIALPDALRAFGRFCISRLAETFPAFVAAHKHPKPFLKSVETIIHVEVKKLYPEAELPCFTYDDPAPDRLIMRYSSKKRLCHLMEGLIDGVAEYYKTPIRHRQTRCILDAGNECEFELVFG